MSTNSSHVRPECRTRGYVIKFDVRHCLALVRLSTFRVAELRYTVTSDLSLLSVDAYVTFTTRCVMNFRTFWNRKVEYKSSISAIKKLDTHILNCRLSFLK
ncbi:hypothetical protein [Xanthomonas euvesicatoria]|uniref:hypothetical protein n=1 Tax=Xanthomonas euvesicatoria TaxID=456327 RepID=UPI001E35FED0|nr:hypothetical protein [Xanthomonas euvesicatoria]